MIQAQEAFLRDIWVWWNSSQNRPFQLTCFTWNLFQVPHVFENVFLCNISCIKMIIYSYKNASSTLPMQVQDTPFWLWSSYVTFVDYSISLILDILLFLRLHVSIWSCGFAVTFLLCILMIFVILLIVILLMILTVLWLKILWNLRVK